MKRLIKEGAYRLTGSAVQGARDLGFDESDIVDCVSHLSPAHLDKTMPSEKVPGTHQDVYRRLYSGHPVYLKLQVPDDAVVVISFKRDDRS